MEPNIEQTKEETIPYQIICALCGALNGKLDLPLSSFDGKALSDKILGIKDSRCASCEETHGSYREMSEFYLQTPDDTSEALEMEIEKAGGDIEAFSRNMAISRPERFFANGNLGQKRINKIRKDLELELGITDLSSDEKVETIRAAGSLDANIIATKKQKVVNRRKPEK